MLLTGKVIHHKEIADDGEMHSIFLKADLEGSYHQQCTGLISHSGRDAQLIPLINLTNSTKAPWVELS